MRTSTKKCAACGARAGVVEARDKVFSATGTHFLVRSVPTRVCRKCGDVSYEAAVSRRLGQIARGINRVRRKVEIPVVVFTEAAQA